MSAGHEPLPPLDCACASLRRAARALTAAYDAELSAAGVNVAQFTLLRAIGAHRGATQGEIGGALCLDATTLTRTLRPLEARRWIRREAGEDRRERLLSLTTAGRRKLDEASAAWRRAQARVRTTLGPAAWARVLADATVVAAAARAS